MAFAQLQKLTPAFDWSGYYTATGLPQGELNVTEPKLMQEFDRQLRETSLADWQTYLRSRVLDSAAPSLSDDFVKAEFAFREEFLNGAREMKPRWKRCARGDRLAARRSARPQVRREVFPAAGEGADAGAGEESATRDEGDDRGPGVDGPADQGSCAGEAQYFQSEDRLPRQVEGLQHGRGTPRRVLGVGGRGASLRRAGRPSSRSTSRSIAAAGSSRRRPRTRTTTRH